MVPYLEVRVFQCLRGGDAVVGVDGEHLRDEVLRFCADVKPVLVVEAVDTLLYLREESRLRRGKIHTPGATYQVPGKSSAVSAGKCTTGESKCNRESALILEGVDVKARGLWSSSSNGVYR